MLARFDIVLVAFPFTDGPNVKPRPAMVICLSERHQDVLLAFISSKVAEAAHRDELDIPADHPPVQAERTEGVLPLSPEQDDNPGDASDQAPHRILAS